MLVSFFRVASDVHRRLSDFIHAVVVHRRDEAVRGWRNWIREDTKVHPYRWLRPDLVLPAPYPFYSEPQLTLGGFGVLALVLMRNFETPGFPTFVALGKGIPALRNSILRLWSGCLFCLRSLCQGLLVRCLLMLFSVKVFLLVALMVGVEGVEGFACLLV